MFSEECVARPRSLSVIRMLPGEGEWQVGQGHKWRMDKSNPYEGSPALHRLPHVNGPIHP